MRLEPPTWRLPREELAAAFSDRTKLILFNTPMNPCSKVFDREELEFIAGLCLKHDAYAVCDEVYEHIIFDDATASVDHDLARNARAHRAHRFGRQELQPDRLEGGLCHGVRPN